MKYGDIFIESIAIYVYLIFVLRFLGKKEMSQLTISDLIVFLVISELMTVSISERSITFFHGALAVFVIVSLDKLCSYLCMKSSFLKKMLEGHPSYIVFQGKINQKKMKALNYSVSDLCHSLREQGIGSLSEVDFAVLETDGNLSIIEKQKSQVVVPDSLINDGEINEELLDLMGKDKSWLIQQLKQEGIDDYHQIFYCVLEKNQWVYIKK